MGENLRVLPHLKVPKNGMKPALIKKTAGEFALSLGIRKTTYEATATSRGLTRTEK
jgi:hypothetical protein